MFVIKDAQAVVKDVMEFVIYAGKVVPVYAKEFVKLYRSHSLWSGMHVVVLARSAFI